MPEFRQTAEENIRRDGHFDVVVVGGGINGIAAFRDLALQGLRVLLVERNDFSSGCSAAPSRMIHGGLRYLENGELSLVAESLRERDLLLKLAPHMVHPLATTIPILSYFSGLLNGAAALFGSGGQPTRRGALAIKIGLSLYDLVTRRNRLLPRHIFRGKSATLDHWPELNPALSCSATYYDAWIRHPERLAIELLTDTRRDAPHVVALNYAELAPGATDGTWTLRGRDLESGLSVTASVIVNATGAWIDRTVAALSGGRPNVPIVSGTKGSHLIIANPALHDALKGHMIFFENADNRVCILFPYLGKVLAGSTDIKVDEPGSVRCEPEERDYILAAVRSVFPRIAIDPGQIVYSFSGIRPLPVSEAEFTGRISRSHFIHRIGGRVPQLCMVGGKWTTFRAFAEQATDAVLAELGRSRIADTTARPIGGGRNHPGDAGKLALSYVEQFGVSPGRARYIAECYGTAGDDLLRFVRGRSDDRPIGTLETTEAEIAWLVQREFVLSVGDIVLRRTTLAITGKLDAGVIGTIVAVLQRELAWTPARAQAERGQIVGELVSFHDVNLDVDFA